MSIISVSYFKKELPEDTDNLNKLVTKAVSRASSFVNTWTSNRHYPFADYDSTTGEPTAPGDIVGYCIEVAKAYYYASIGQVSRNGEERRYWLDNLKIVREELQTIKISPEWYTKLISLDSNNIMSLGGTSVNHGVFQVVPCNAEIIDGASNWERNNDWKIVQGAYLSPMFDADYISDAWYLYSLYGSSLDGTVHYMRTYRKDGGDYAQYSRMDVA